MSTSSAAAEAGSAEQPLFSVVRGEPTAEELAALTAVLLAAASGGEPEPAPASPWGARGAQTRRPLDHGPGAWRASGLPR